MTIETRSQRRALVVIDGRRAVPGTLEVEIERIDVTVATKTSPDPGWEHVDQQGHYHAWTHDGQLPTLITKDEHRPCTGVHLDGTSADGCEGYTVRVHECSICGEAVEPATISRPGEPESIPGRASWSVETEQAAAVRGQRVSVHMDHPHEVLFGIGIVDTVTATSDMGGPVRALIRIVGTTPLGRRPSVSRSAAW